VAVFSGTLCTMHVIFFIVECGIAHFLSGMRVLEVRVSSSPRGYLCVKFRFCSDLCCWASPRRKIAYWPTQSITQLIWCDGNWSFRFGKYSMIGVCKSHSVPNMWQVFGAIRSVNSEGRWRKRERRQNI